MSATALARAAKQLGRPLVIAVLNIDGSGRLRQSPVPHQLLNLVLKPLAKARRLSEDSVSLDYPPVRLLVDLPRDSANELVRSAGLPTGSLVDLDSDSYAPRIEDFENWLCTLLTVRGGLYAGGEIRIARETARAVAQRAWPNFLLAETVALTLRARPQLWDVETGGELPEDLPSAWNFFTASAGAAAPRLRSLLAPLVAAEGPHGVPEKIWQSTASLLLEEEITARQLQAAAGLAAAFVERSDIQGRTGTVPHWKLRDGGLARAAAATLGAEVDARMAQALQPLVPEQDVAAVSGAVVTEETHYALHFGVAHSAKAALLDEWLAAPSRALLTDPETLDEALRTAGPVDSTADKRRRAALWEERRSYHRRPERNLAERAARLQLCATVCQDEPLASWLDGCGLRLPWRTLWASLRPLGVMTTEQISPHWPGPVDLIATRTSNGDEQVCLEGWIDRQYRWWSLATGNPVGAAFQGEPDDEWDDQEAPWSVWIDEDSINSDVFVRTTDEMTDRPVEWMVSATQYMAEVRSLPGNRFVLAGHGGVALFEVAGGPRNRRLAADRKAVEQSPWMFQPEWLSQAPLSVGALDLLWRLAGPRVTTRPEAATSIAHLPEVARLLTEVGLPEATSWFTCLRDFVPSLPALESYAAQSIGRFTTNSNLIVVGKPIQGSAETFLCIDRASGRVVIASPTEETLVNSSLDRFLRSLVIAYWASAFATSRDHGELREFTVNMQRLMKSVDPEAVDGGHSVSFWRQLLADETTWLLE
ncbi:SUKH-4 family immunity protein [Streptomyces gobiensis]|uniref:SUKH-4 family immunity protein n=1 Tax=Streptomyces gobiensis TaxID=2875706 RepID=UPI001E387969|nr:SUKH-4 family immunity protein [Streptomyces gobiensis]UGY93945.1 SUKH-4 family immunity protein [Streptomyces gobiensis]